jgi:protein ImuB
VLSAFSESNGLSAKVVNDTVFHVNDAGSGVGDDLVRIGIADGPFAAAFAARSSTPIVEAGESAAFLAPYSLRALIAVEGGRAIGKAARSSKRPVTSEAPDAQSLVLIDTVDLLERLGITTLGAFAALDRADVLARFGSVGLRAWRLASGRDARIPNTRLPPPDLTVEVELDPPVERIDTAAFYAKALAEEFTDRLSRLGLACTRINIEAETERGETLQRLWRHERAGAAGGLSAAGLADRMRWQLDGWLQRIAIAERDLQRDAQRDAKRDAQRDKRFDSQRDAQRDGRFDTQRDACEVVPRSEWLTGGLVRLRLSPDEVVADDGRQLGLWGGVTAADERAARAFARVQALLGPQAVCSVVSVGGRRPVNEMELVPWGDQRDVAKSNALTSKSKSGKARTKSVKLSTKSPAKSSAKTGNTDTSVKATAPWPGRLPTPSPTIAYPLPTAVTVLDKDGRPIRVNGRGEISAPPVSFGSSTDTFAGKSQNIVAWAGPWPLEERWWDLQTARRQARLQIVVADSAQANMQRAFLVVLEGGQWWLEASYS